MCCYTLSCTAGLYEPNLHASLSLLGGQDKKIFSIFPHFSVFALIFPQIFFIFFLILVFRVRALVTPLQTCSYSYDLYFHCASKLHDLYTKLLSCVSRNNRVAKMLTNTVIYKKYIFTKFCRLHNVVASLFSYHCQNTVGNLMLT